MNEPRPARFHFYENATHAWQGELAARAGDFSLWTAVRCKKAVRLGVRSCNQCIRPSTWSSCSGPLWKSARARCAPHQDMVLPLLDGACTAPPRIALRVGMHYLVFRASPQSAASRRRVIRHSRRGGLTQHSGSFISTNEPVSIGERQRLARRSPRPER
jgi:hypothetical protein